MTLTLNSHSNPIHILNTYSPQSGVGKDDKERDKIKDQYFDELENKCDEIPESEILMIYGDMNARLQARLDTEHDILGKHVFGRGQKILEHNSPKEAIDNRFRFIDFCKADNFLVMNTMFEKPSKNYCAR